MKKFVTILCVFLVAFLVVGCRTPAGPVALTAVSTNTPEPTVLPTPIPTPLVYIAFKDCTLLDYRAQFDDAFIKKNDNVSESYYLSFGPVITDSDSNSVSDINTYNADNGLSLNVFISKKTFKTVAVNVVWVKNETVKNQYLFWRAAIVAAIMRDTALAKTIEVKLGINDSTKITKEGYAASYQVNGLTISYKFSKGVSTLIIATKDHVQ